MILILNDESDTSQQSVSKQTKINYSVNTKWTLVYRY